jgi:hypothetical protein
VIRILEIVEEDHGRPTPSECQEGVQHGLEERGSVDFWRWLAKLRQERAKIAIEWLRYVQSVGLDAAGSAQNGDNSAYAAVAVGRGRAGRMKHRAAALR